MMNLSSIRLNKQAKILIIIFFVLIVYVDSSYILKAQRSGLRRLAPKISKLTTDLENLKRGLASMQAAKSKSGGVAPRKVVGSSRILREGQVSELLQEISSAANKFNIKIAQIRPSRQIQKDKSAITQDKHTVMLINLELISDYHNLGKFIQALESSAVFMGVQDLDISMQPSDFMKQKITLVLRTYVTK